MLWWDFLLFGGLTAISTAAIGWFAAYWLRLDGWTTSIALWLATLLVLRNLTIHQMRWFSLLLMRRPRLGQARPGWRVGAVTTFVPGVEPLDMLERTVRALVAMDYPHDTWVLDEGDDERVRRLCQRLGALHFSRRHRPQYQRQEGPFQARTKHGNYNAWLHELGFDRYEIIAAFDPDHIPAADYLTSVLGSFADPAIGYVQAAQVYYNQSASFIARGAAEETYAYYSSIQMAYHGLQHPVVTGCHQTHRATALQQVGGFAAHDADDLLITLHYRAAGWRGVYVPRILARGLTPVDWPGYIGQQRRWARSVLDVKFRHLARLAGRLSPTERLVSLLHGVYYLQGVSAVFGVGVLATMLSTGYVPAFLTYATLGHVTALALVLRLTDFYKQRFFLDPPSEWGLLWRAPLLQLAKWPYFLLAFVEAALGRKRPYFVTPKVAGQARTYLLLWPHGSVVLLLGVAAAIGAAIGRTPVTAVYLASLATAAVSLACIWSESWTYPAAYDDRLASEAAPTARAPR